MPSLSLHRISVVRVYLSIAATTQDPAGQDPHQVPEEEEEEQQIENLFEPIMKENFPRLAKEIDFQEVQEAQRVPKKPKEEHTKAHHHYITQD